MATFYDDFNRANGALGASWPGAVGVAISNYAVVGAASGSASCGMLSDSGEQHATVHVVAMGAVNGHMCGVTIKRLSGASYGIAAVIRYVTDHWEFQLVHYEVSGWIADTADNLGASIGGVHTIDIGWADGTFTATLDGLHQLTLSTGLFYTNDRMGLIAVGSDMAILDWSGTAGAAQQFDITEEAIGNYGTPSPIHATCTSDNWTPGIPGTPVFLCNHGTITTQEVVSSSTAAMTFDPGSYLGFVTFTDPSTGLTDQLLVTSNPNVIPPTDGERPSIPGAKIIDDVPITYSPVGLRVLSNKEVIVPASGGSPEVDIVGALRSIFNMIVWNPPLIEYNLSGVVQQLWRGVNGMMDLSDYTQVNGIHKSLNEMIFDFKELWWDGSGGRYYTVDDILNQVGDPQANLQPILDALGLANYPLYTSIAQMIRDTRGDDVSSVLGVLSELGYIRTQGGYTLGDVKDWIDALSPTNLQDILDKLAKIQPYEDVDLTTLGVDVANVKGVADSILSSLQAYRTNSAYTVQDILDAISNIPETNLQAVLNAIAALRGDNVSTVKDTEDSLKEWRGLPELTAADLLGRLIRDDSPDGIYMPALTELLLYALMGDETSVATELDNLSAGQSRTWPQIATTLGNAATYFLNLWDALRAGGTGTPSGVAPAYPGLDKVQLGDIVPFDSDIVLSQRMDGALIDISVVGEHPWPVKFSNPTRYGRLGTFAFACDTERMEPIQPIQYKKQVATPKGIVTPTGLVIQCKQGTQGTVTPYLLAT